MCTLTSQAYSSSQGDDSIHGFWSGYRDMDAWHVVGLVCSSLWTCSVRRKVGVTQNPLEQDDWVGRDLALLQVSCARNYLLSKLELCFGVSQRWCTPLTALFTVLSHRNPSEREQPSLHSLNSSLI